MFVRFQDFLFGNVVNESIVYFSPVLRSLLKRVDHPISKSLLEIEKKDAKPDITFIDYLNDDYLSFTTMANAEKEFKEKHPHLDILNRPYDSIADALYTLRNDTYQDIAQVYTKSRNQIKLGRLINKFFPNKFTAKEVEEFINKFKSLSVKPEQEFKLVEGEDIEFWYDQKNYKSLTGQLGNSCMRNIKGVFDIFTKNPEVCKMLILIEEDKLVGRALVWRISSAKNMSGEDIEVEWFMDRQYTTEDSFVEKFRNYAKEKNWTYKTHNNHLSLKGVTVNEKNLELEMTVKLNDNLKYSAFPYLDTFRRYSKSKSIIYNNSEEDVVGDFILDQTDGTSRIIEDGVWSEYYDTRIDRNLAIYSEPLGDWLYSDSSITVYSGSRRNIGVYPDDFDDIVWCDNEEEYYYTDDAVYSEEYQTYIPEDKSVSVVYEISKSGDVNSDEYYVEMDDDIFISFSNFKEDLWYQESCEIDSDWTIHIGIMKELLMKDSNGKYIPKVYSTETFKNLSGPEGIKFLSEIDSIILDKKIDKDVKVITDKWQYNKSIMNIVDEIKKKSVEKLQDDNFSKLWIEITKRLKDIDL
jgi:hypothetical protein